MIKNDGYLNYLFFLIYKKILKWGIKYLNLQADNKEKGGYCILRK